MTRRRALTLRGRVALVAVAVLAVWVLLLTTGVNVVLGNRLAAQADDALRARAQAAAATIDVAADGGFAIRDNVDDAAIDVGTWIFHSADVVEEPVGSQGLRAVAAGLTGRGQLLMTTGGSSGVRWYAEPVSVDGRQLGTVVTSLSLAPYGSTERLALVATAILAVLLLVGAYLALRASIGLALRPVDAMTQQAARWSADDVERRFGVDHRPAELEELAATLDGVLDRIAAVLRHEKHLSAEISHELRTPLARLSAEMQLLRHDPEVGAGARSSLASLNTEVVEMSAILEALMSAARTGSDTPNGRCDAELVVRGLALRRDPPPAVRVRGGSSQVGVESVLLERVLSPVLDNAYRYARSRVAVDIVGERGEVVIDISDDGTGIEGIELSDVFEPGRRGVAPDGHSGAGLGLSLSRRLVLATDGAISVSSSPAGTVFSVRLPSG